jgi:hypothetical protein
MSNAIGGGIGQNLESADAATITKDEECHPVPSVHRGADLIPVPFDLPRPV